MKLDVLQLSDGKKTMKHDLHKPMFWRGSDRRDERKKLENETKARVLQSCTLVLICVFVLYAVFIY